MHLFFLSHRHELINLSANSCIGAVLFLSMSRECINDLRNVQWSEGAMLFFRVHTSVFDELVKFSTSCRRTVGMGRVQCVGIVSVVAWLCCLHLDRSCRCASGKTRNVYVCFTFLTLVSVLVLATTVKCLRLLKISSTHLSYSYAEELFAIHSNHCLNHWHL